VLKVDRLLPLKNGAKIGLPIGNLF